MDTRKFGNIFSVEEWRYQELNKLKIEFSSNKKLEDYIIKENGNPVFYKGMFITGNSTKGDILKVFSKALNVTSIAFVDDRKLHLEDVQKYCHDASINFTGILFDSLKNLQGLPNPKLTDFQKRYLLENAIWLEDEAAYKLMAENMNS